MTGKIKICVLKIIHNGKCTKCKYEGFWGCNIPDIKPYDRCCINGELWELKI